MKWSTGLVLALLIGCGHAPAEERTPPPGDPVQEVPGEQLFAQGVSLAQAGDLVRSEQYLLAALERGYPEDRLMPVLLRVLIAASRLRVALGYAEPYLARNPDAWPLRYLVATIHLGMERPELARRELERVIATAPDAPDPHFLLGIVLRDAAGDAAAAEPHFQRYLELAPEGSHANEARDALARVPVATVAGDEPSAPDRNEPAEATQ